jgi:hypothetical protein
MVGKLGWFHPKVALYDQQGRGISDHNFRHEARSPLAIFIRELLQNALDARLPESEKPVTVCIRWLKSADVDTKYLDECVDEDFITRLRASSGKEVALDQEKPVALVVEDFGTMGLQGTWCDSTVDGANENYNAFWFREGEGAKGDNSSNGGAGQGKISFYLRSAVRTVLGFTVRADDGQRLLFGRAVFNRDYRLDEGGKKFKRIAYWCREDDGMPLPALDPVEIDSFSKAFSVKRKDEPGLSLVLPFPQDRDPGEVLKVVLGEFFFPIARGRLVVHVDETEITASTIVTLADVHLKDDEVRNVLGISLTAGYRSFLSEIISGETNGSVPVVMTDDWRDASTLSSACFPDGSVESLKAKLSSGERIYVRFPVVVRRRKQPPVKTFIDVHLQVPDDLEFSEEAYIRQDLLIGEERRLKNAHHLPKARALTFVCDEPLSRLLADAEEASHLLWNASREKLQDNWMSEKEILRLVRQAAPRLLAFLASAEGKRDSRALARFFARPSPEGSKKTAGVNRNKGGDPPIPPSPPPLPEPELFVLDPKFTAVELRGRGHSRIVGGEGYLEVAYRELGADSFRSYDPFDFDFGNEAEYPVIVSGCEILKKHRNRVTFKAFTPNMTLTASGFDPNVRLDARLVFKEAADGADEEIE